MNLSLLQVSTSNSVVLSSIIGIVIIALLLFYFFFARGIYLVSDTQIGVLIKKFGGPRMPQGQIIARKGQIGIQAHTLMPGLYWKNPIFWRVRKFPITEI